MAIVLDQDSVFNEVKQARTDDQGRLLLGREFSNLHYRVATDSEGQMLLTPMVSIPVRDAWLYQNPERIASLRQGIEDVAAGRVGTPQDFSKYALTDEGNDD